MEHAKINARHEMPAGHRITQELREMMTPVEFSIYEDILRYTRNAENMQFQLAWKYGKEGKTFDEFMQSFGTPVSYVYWGERL